MKFLVAFLASVSLAAHGQTNLAPPDSSATATQTTTVVGGLQAGTTTAVTTPTAAGATASTTQLAGAKSSNTGAVIEGGVMAAAGAVVAYTQCDWTAGLSTLCYAGLAAMAVGVAVAATADSSNKDSVAPTTAALTATPTTTTTDGTTTTTSTPAPSNNQTPPAISAAVGKLASVGITMDPKTGNITMPDGTKVSAADAAAGKFPGTAGNGGGAGAPTPAEIQAAAGGILKKAQASVDGVEGDPTAGDGLLPGGRSNKSNSAAAVAMPGPFGVGAKKPAARDPAALAGAAKVLADGTRIGVSQDSIFDMMTRRYNSEYQQQKVITPADAPAGGPTTN